MALRAHFIRREDTPPHAGPTDPGWRVPGEGLWAREVPENSWWTGQALLQRHHKA